MIESFIVGFLLGGVGFLLFFTFLDELKVGILDKKYKVISKTDTDLVLKKGRLFFLRSFHYKWNEKRHHWISKKGTQPNPEMLEAAIKVKRVKDFGVASADEAWGYNDNSQK